MNKKNLIQTAEYVKLAEVSYVDFSKIRDLNDKSLIKNGLMYEIKDGEKVPNLPQSYAEQFVKDWSVKAQWTDREEETSFSATLFQKNETNGEYVLAFKGSLEPKDFWQADGFDIVLDGFALKQSIDLINFRQQLLGEDGKAYKVLTLQYDHELNYIDDLLGRGDVFEAITEEEYHQYTEQLNNALASGQYIKDGGDLYKMEWVNSDEYYGKDDDRVTGKGLSWDKITITGHSLGGNLAAIYSTWFANEVENTVTVNGAGFHNSVLNGTNNNFRGCIRLAQKIVKFHTIFARF